MKTKHFKSRHALLMSLTSLTLCVSMLFGATFAWFTDSVTSGVNRIVSGNLDVELYHQNSQSGDTALGDVASKVTNNTMLFDASVDNSHLWEPGAMSYETFKVENKGSLALKYAFTMLNAGNNTVFGTTDSLLDVLKVAVVDGTPATLTRAAVAADTSLDWVSLKTFIGKTDIVGFSGNLYPASTSDETHASDKTFTVFLYWPESSSDNTYNLQNGKVASDAATGTVGELWVKLGINLYATQLQNETDSFDNTYDAGVNLPVVSIASTNAMTTTFAENSTESLEITKSGVIESASVPAAAANAVFSEMADPTAGASNEMTMNLNVEKTGETTDTVSGATTVDLDIDMTAVMKTTTTAGTTTSTQDVTSLEDYVTINYNLGAGKTVTGVTHSGAPMELLASADAAVSAANALVGGYYYDAATGILTIKTKSFSPFSVAYTVPATGITLDKETAEVAVGKTVTLTATVTPADSTDSVTWTSADPSIATVDKNGEVTGVAAGEATITATAGTRSTVCTVTVAPEWGIVKRVSSSNEKQYFASIQEAFDEANDGDTLYLLKDVELTGSTLKAYSNQQPVGVQYNKNAEITFDMGRHTLSSASASGITHVLHLTTGEMTIKNGVLSNYSTTVSTDQSALLMTGDAVATIKDNITIDTYGNGIMVGLYASGKPSTARITELNAVIRADGLTGKNNKCVYMVSNTRIDEITGGTYDSFVSMDVATMGNNCCAVSVGGYSNQYILGPASIGTISDGTFTSSYPATLRIDGTVDTISGGVFTYYDKITNYGAGNTSIVGSGSVSHFAGGKFVSRTKADGSLAAVPTVFNDALYRATDESINVDCYYYTGTWTKSDSYELPVFEFYVGE